MIKSILTKLLVVAIMTNSCWGDSETDNSIRGSNRCPKTFQDFKTTVYNYVTDSKRLSDVCEWAHSAYAAVVETQTKNADMAWKKFVIDSLQQLKDTLQEVKSTLQGVKDKVDFYHGPTPVEIGTLSVVGSDFDKCSQICKRLAVGRSGAFTDSRIYKCCADNYQYNSGHCIGRNPVCQEPQEDATHRSVKQCNLFCDPNHADNTETQDALRNCCIHNGYPTGKCDEWNHAVCWHFNV